MNTIIQGQSTKTARCQTNKTENKTVEIKMDNLDIQTNIIMPGIKLKLLSTRRMNMVLPNLFKYWMKSNLNIFLN